MRRMDLQLCFYFLVCLVSAPVASRNAAEGMPAQLRTDVVEQLWAPFMRIQKNPALVPLLDGRAPEVRLQPTSCVGGCQWQLNSFHRNTDMIRTNVSVLRAFHDRSVPLTAWIPAF